MEIFRTHASNDISMVDKIYQIVVNGDATYLNNTKIYLNTEDDNLTYMTIDVHAPEEEQNHKK